MEDTANSSHRPIEELLAELRVAGPRPDEKLLDAIRALGMEGVPALIAMVIDPAEYEVAEGDEDRTGWAPYFAVKILGELHPPEALQPLLSLITWDDYDYLSEDLPEVLAKFGRPALVPLTAVLSDQEKTVWTRWRAVRTMQGMVEVYPELRDEVVARLTAQLDIDEPETEDVDILRGALVSELVKLKAEESLPSIIRAFEETLIDPFVISWSDVQRKLNLPPDVAPHLNETAPTRRPIFQPSPEMPPLPGVGPAMPKRLETPSWAQSEPYRREQPKVGRNDPCPCGSGKKYKKCHGK